MEGRERGAGEANPPFSNVNFSVIFDSSFPFSTRRETLAATSSRGKIFAQYSNHTIIIS